MLPFAQAEAEQRLTLCYIALKKTTSFQFQYRTFEAKTDAVPCHMLRAAGVAKATSMASCHVNCAVAQAAVTHATTWVQQKDGWYT
jgi:hypothetical protein